MAISNGRAVFHFDVATMKATVVGSFLGPGLEGLSAYVTFEDVRGAITTVVIDVDIEGEVEQRLRARESEGQA